MCQGIVWALRIYEWKELTFYKWWQIPIMANNRPIRGGQAVHTGGLKTTCSEKKNTGKE
jgi:hypothetical protein